MRDREKLMVVPSRSVALLLLGAVPVRLEVLHGSVS